jgi:hypothetical protein
MRQVRLALSRRRAGVQEARTCRTLDRFVLR